MSLYMQMRRDFPYCLSIKGDEVYFINRDYEYIGYNTKCLSDIREDCDDFERTYIYNDGSKPFDHDGTPIKKNYNNAIDKIQQICGFKTVKIPEYDSSSWGKIR